MSSALLRLLIGPRSTADSANRFVLAPIRLFFGATFVYAGLQKLTDPQFFSPTAPGFIGRQMSGFVHGGSPLSFLLTAFALGNAKEFGALIAFCELWVGLATLLGLFARAGAVGGLAISFTLYLTATWNVHPYFLGADLPYAVGWLTLILAGPDRYSLDEYFFAGVLRARPYVSPSPSRRGRARPAPAPLAENVLRAVFLRALGTAGAVAAGGGVIGVIAKLLTPNEVFTVAPSPLTTPANGSPGSSVTNAPAGATLLGNVKSLPVNSAGQYTDPGTGDPAVLVHLPNGRFAAYDAVCTHAGCTVQYDPSQSLLVCPCHGATFDPAHGAQVLAGPAPTPLTSLAVKIDAKGNAYAVRAAGQGGGTS